MSKLTGAEIVVECLKEQGVDTVFGYPGGAILNIYDALYQHQDEITHILTSHEQGASHAADGYARATGRVGVCLATSGPGATNLVTGIATAYMDSVPVVAITCNVTNSLLGKDSFQEIDITGVTMPITKYNFIVKDVNRLATVIRRAFTIAQTGRPGPVLVDLPKDVVQAKAEFVWPEAVSMRSYNPTYKPNLNQLRRSVEELARAERPVILAGGGVILSDAAEALTALARKVHVPVTGTLMGLGGFAATDPLWTGMVGMHGTYAANMVINNADMLLCVGARFDDRVTGKLTAFAPKARIVHIDIDPTSIRKNVEVHVPVVGDCRLALEGMLAIVEAKLEGKDWAAEHKAWLETVAGWKNARPLNYQKKDGSIKPQEVVEALHTLTGGEAIIATEVGQHQMWVAQFYSFTRPRTLLTSGGLGTMGFGFPASLGAQFAFPDRKVITVAGDGSFQMNVQELGTVVANRLPIKVVILNNRHLGMVRQWQELFYEGNYSFTNMEAQPDFVKLADAYGAEGYRISTPEELLPVLEKALNSPNPAIIDVQVAREENVYPIVPAGAALDEMLLV